jgi:hypothetical protein
MTLYGDPDHVIKMLRATPTWDLGTDVEERLLAIQASISLLLEEACGRTWGTPDEDDTTRLQWVGPYSMLVLDVPARSITSITTGGTVSGSTMTGGSVTLAAELQNRIVSRDGLIYAISNAFSGEPWPSYYGTTYAQYPVAVTGQFGNIDDDDEVPADVTYAANYPILNTYRHEAAGVAGFSGPDGSTIPIRDPWKDPQVLKVIDKYSLRKQWAV